MDRPDHIAKVAVVTFFVRDQKSVKPEIGNHRHDEKNGTDDADDAKVFRSQQPREYDRTYRPDNHVPCARKDDNPRPSGG